MAKLANLNNGNAPTTMAGTFGQLLRHVHGDENVPGGVFHLAQFSDQGYRFDTDIAFSIRLHTKLYKFG